MLWHLTFAAAGRHPLFHGEAVVRAAARALVRVAGRWIVLFSIVDDHIHVIVLCDRATAGRLAQRLLLALRSLTTVDVEPRAVRPVNGRRHMQTLLGYLLLQPAHHGLPAHPVLWEGGCFADLAGARCIDGFQPRIRDALPRFRLRDAWDAVEQPPVELAPAPGAAIRTMGAHRLGSAAAAAACVTPSLQGRSRPVLEARAATARLGAAAGIARTELAVTLACSPQTVGRLLRHRPNTVLDAAIRRHLTLEASFPAVGPLLAPAADRG